MRILQIVHLFPPESIAGTQRYCEALSQALVRRGHECLVLSGSDRSAPEAALATVVQGGLSVTRYVRADGRGRHWTEEYDPDAEGLIRRFLDIVRPDLVHLHHWHGLTKNLVAICADLAIPAVVTLHDVWTTCPRTYRIRRDGLFCEEPPATAPCLACAERGPWQTDREVVAALALRRASMDRELALAAAIVVPSEAHRGFLLRLIELPHDRLTVVPNGAISTVTRRPRDAAAGPGFPGRPLQIGHWGHFMREKGTHVILEALCRLRDPSTVHLHLIGGALEEEYGAQLLALARDLPVTLHGPYQPADLCALDLDVAVFASITSESYSFALDEAVRLGLPVLVSDRGALPERIGPGGLTFQAGDAGDLARRLQEILDAPEVLEGMRRNIRPDALLSMEAHVAALEKIYEDAVNCPTPARHSPTPHLELAAHARQQVREREAVLAHLQERLAQVDRALREKEALLHEAERALQEKEALLLQTRRALDTLQDDHAHLSASLMTLKQTPLFKLQDLLTKLSRRS
jgi:glycosyltransferase involved in cell wall biosynthesis